MCKISGFIKEWSRSKHKTRRKLTSFAKGLQREKRELEGAFLRVMATNKARMMTKHTSRHTSDLRQLISAFSSPRRGQGCSTVEGIVIHWNTLHAPKQYWYENSIR